MRMLQEKMSMVTSKTMTQEYNGINTMFMEHYDHVPPYFIREESDFTYMNHGVNNPFILKEEDEESGPLD